MTFGRRGAGALALACIAAAAGGCEQDSVFDAVVEVKLGSVNAEIAVDGAAQLVDDRSLRFGTAGTVEALHAAEGEAIQEGELIAELDGGPLDVALAKAEADLLAAADTLEELRAPPSAADLELAQAAVQDERDALAHAEGAVDVASATGAKSIDDARDVREEAYEAYRYVFRKYYGFQPSDDQILDAPPQILASQDNPPVLKYWGTLIPSVARQSDIDAELEAAWLAAREAANRYARAVADDGKALLNASKAITQARANLRAAEERLQALENGPDAAAVRRAEAAHAAAQQAVQAAIDALSGALLTAPFDGTLLELTIAPGDSVSRAAVVGLFADTQRMEVVALVDELDVLRVAVGQRASISPITSPFDAFEGVVTAVGQLPAPGPTVRYPVTLAAETGGLRDGMRVAVEIELERKTDVIVLPIGAIQRDGLEYVVQVVDEDGLTSRRKVRIGAYDQFNAEITSGVREGELVVDFATPTSQSSFLRDGRPLR